MYKFASKWDCLVINISISGIKILMAEVTSHKYQPDQEGRKKMACKAKNLKNLKA